MLFFRTSCIYEFKQNSLLFIYFRLIYYEGAQVAKLFLPLNHKYSFKTIVMGTHNILTYTQVDIRKQKKQSTEGHHKYSYLKIVLTRTNVLRGIYRFPGLLYVLFSYPVKTFICFITRDCL